MIRVVKIGGSLLPLPDLGERLRQWLSRQTPAHHVLLVGGGSLVEEVRRLHAAAPIDDVAAHWMCIDLLTVTAHLLHAWLPEIPLVEDDRLLCQRVGDVGCTIFGPAPWLRHSEPGLPGVWLRTGWDTTSDAIAGRLAVALRASEYVMLKSRLPRRGMRLELIEMARTKFVDGMLPHMAHELPLTRIVDFRSNAFEEQRLPRLGNPDGVG